MSPTWVRVHFKSCQCPKHTSSFSLPFSPLLLTPSRETVKVFSSTPYPTERQVEETDRHPEDYQLAEIKAGKKRWQGCNRFPDGKGVKVIKTEALKVQFKLKCPSKVHCGHVSPVNRVWYTAAAYWFINISFNALQIYDWHVNTRRQSEGSWHFGSASSGQT